MRIKIIGTGRLLSSEESRLMERQLQYALSRFDTLIQTVLVTVEDGSNVSECCVRLKLRTGGEVAVSDRQPDLASATRQAAQRAAGALDRQRDFPRIERRARIYAGMQFGD
jgi:hypothetical protein